MPELFSPEPAQQPKKRNHFFDYVHLQPRHYLIFADKKARGSSSKKTHILMKNISQVPIVYRVAQRKDNNLVISCRPFMQLLLPDEQKRIEVLLETMTNDSVPTLSSSLIIEIVPYKQGIVEEWSPNLFQDPNLFAKEKESYEYRLFETNLLNFIGFEYAFNRIEARVLVIEDAVQKWIGHEMENMKSTQIALLSLVLTVLVVFLLARFLPIGPMSQHLYKNFG